MARVPSFTFAGGVLSEGLWGRVDLNKYQTGLRVARNFQVAIEGGAEKRFGTYLVGKRKFQDKVSRLVPWRIANDDSYMLEFGNLYIRFIRFGGYVSIPGGHVALPGNEAANVSGFMEIVTPYLAADLAQLKFTYANDVMYLTHPKYPPQELSRLGLYDWSFNPTSFTPHASAPTGLAAVYHDNTVAGDNYVAEPVPTSYKISATMADGTETLSSATVTVNADTGHRRCWVSLSWAAKSGAIQYTIYKGKNGIFGFIGYTTGTSYDDRNYAPSYDVVPLGTPYAWPAGEYPRVSEFYKQRKAYAASVSNPQRLLFSKPLVFASLYHGIPQQDDDALDITLVGRERHTINHMVELKKFLIFTDTAEWVMSTDNNGPLTIATANPTKETAYGAHPDLRPLSIGDRLLFIQNTTNAIRDMGYEFTSDSFKADDLSRLARDLFKNKDFVAWDYSAFPGNLLPCVMTDGTVNVLAYAREHEIWAWSNYDTLGKFTDTACVVEGNEVAEYYQVARTINGVTTYFVERKEVNFNDRIEDMVYVDCALTFKSSLAFTNLVRVSETVATVTVTGNGYEVGDELQLELADGSILRAEITVDGGANLNLSPVRTTEFPESFASSTGSAFLCVNTVTGFDHLIGEDVWILADGKVFKTIDIALDGSITLPIKACRIHAGLPYSAELETLDIDQQNAAGLYISRTADEVVIRLRNSRGVAIQATNAETFRDPVYIESRSDENMYDAPRALSGPYEIPTHVGYGLECGIRVLSNDPLPCNVMNIVPNVQYQG